MEPCDIHTLSLFSQIQWRPGIGDPTIVGWLTVIAYLATFLLSVACAKKLSYRESESAAVQSKLWWLIALAMLLLGINKQLDFQTLLTEIGKVLAKRQGWYEQRRIVQALFIMGIGCGGFFSLMIVWRSCLKIWKENCLAIIGLTFLICFVVVRAASFHHMDLFLGSYISGFKINWILELGGIALIMSSAIFHLKRKSTYRQQVTMQKAYFL